VAPARHKGSAGAGGFSAAIAGIGLGVAVVMVVLAACTPQQLVVFGWRCGALGGFGRLGQHLDLAAHS
jgi:hypothetical protein